MRRRQPAARARGARRLAQCSERRLSAGVAAYGDDAYAEVVPVWRQRTSDVAVRHSGNVAAAAGRAVAMRMRATRWGAMRGIHLSCTTAAVSCGTHDLPVTMAGTMQGLRAWWRGERRCGDARRAGRLQASGASGARSGVRPSRPASLCNWFTRGEC